MSRRQPAACPPVARSARGPAPPSPPVAPPASPLLARSAQPAGEALGHLLAGSVLQRAAAPSCGVAGPGALQRAGWPWSRGSKKTWSLDEPAEWSAAPTGPRRAPSAAETARVRRRAQIGHVLLDVPPLLHEIDELHRQLGLYGTAALAENRAKVRGKAIASLVMAGVDIGTAGASVAVTSSIGVMLEMIETEGHEASALVSTPFRTAQQARAGQPGPAKPGSGPDHWGRAGWAAKGVDIGLKAVETPAHMPGAAKTLGIAKNVWTLYKSGQPFVLDQGNREYVSLAMRDLSRLRGALASKQRDLRSLNDRRLDGLVEYIRLELPVIDELLSDLRALVATSTPAAPESPSPSASDGPRPGHRRRGAVDFGAEDQDEPVVFHLGAARQDEPVFFHLPPTRARR